MKKLSAAALIVLTISGSALAEHGSGTFTQTGTILVAGPQTRSYGGVSEILSPCGGSVDPDVPAGIAQGVDGYWFELPEGATGHAATLTADRVNNVDAWFYDAGCALIKPAADPEAYKMATDNPIETGVIPAAAAFVVVDLYLGAAANFTFSVAGAA